MNSDYDDSFDVYKLYLKNTFWFIFSKMSLIEKNSKIFTFKFSVTALVTKWSNQVTRRHTYTQLR